MLELVRRKGSPYWIARGTIEGRRVERSTRCRSKNDARKVLSAIIADLTSDLIGRDGLRFDQAVAMYLDAHPDARFLEPIMRHFRDMPVKDINLTEMRRAANQLYPDAAAATVKRQLYTPIKAILNHAADEELCQRPQFKSPKGGNKRTVFFLPSEADRLIMALTAHQHPHFAVLATFMFGQGTRVGETLAMEWQDVSLENRFAILRKTKNSMEKRVTLVDRTVAALSTIRPSRAVGRVFLRSDGCEFTVGKKEGGQIKYQWEKACEAAGLDPRAYTPHTTRHSWATWFYSQTKDVLLLKHEGGWNSNEWERYVKLATPELAEEARRFGWIFDGAGENRGKVANYA